jgi:hydroxymethylpyrimidine/phosphomethylpyrimidine kinase
VTRRQPPVALTIAGSDSGGGAGVAADLATFAAHRVFGTLAICSITAQDTVKIHDRGDIASELVVAQIEAVLGDLAVAAVKTGMLGSLENLDAVTSLASAGRLPRLVVDPVLVASSGDRLMALDGHSGYRALLASALVATPNLEEAGALLGSVPSSVDEMVDAARVLHGLGPTLAVVTGGHLALEESVDVAFDGHATTLLRAPRIPTQNHHGTGCTLSAAICAELALGRTPLEALRAAKSYVTEALRSAAGWKLGRGHGPLDHSWDR